MSYIGFMVTWVERRQCDQCHESANEQDRGAELKVRMGPVGAE